MAPLLVTPREAPSARRTHGAVPVVLLVLGGLTTAVALALPVTERIQVISVAQVVSCAAGVVGLAWLRPARPVPWLMILLAAASYAAAWHALRLGAPDPVVVVLSCTTYVAIGVLVVTTSGRRADHAGLEWFDIALLAVAVASVTAHLPWAGDPSTGTWVALQSAGSVVLLALLRWVVVGGRQSDAGARLLVGVLGGLLAWHLWTLVLAVGGRYAPGAASDVLIVIGWALVAASLWHPYHAHLGRPSPTLHGWVPSSMGTVVALLVLGVTPLLAAADRAGWTLGSSVVLGVLLLARELVARRNTARAAGSDPLTGLGNRTALLRALVRHLARPGAHSALLCMVDVVDFARINEHRGHHAGDEVLRAVARRIDLAVAGASVHRLSGDAFAVVVPGALAPGQHGESRPVPHPATSALLAALGEPFGITGEAAPVVLSVTIGEAPVVPWGDLDRDDPTAVDDEAVAVVQRAELALADARSRGRTSWRVTRRVVERHQRHRRLVSELEGALARGEVVPHYQAQVDLRSGLPVGVEALARWEHPSLGVLPPAEILPAAEELDLLDGVDAAVLHRALHDLAAWRAAEPALARLRVSVNASASSLRRPDVVDRVVAALTAAGLPGSALELEITESASLEHRTGLEDVLRELRGIGVSIAVDDFGSGYASMDYLVRFQADTVKVDRSLVVRLGQERGHQVLAAVVALVHDLSAQVLAEGTEDEEAVEAVRALGFDVVQGFAHGLPGPACDVPAALRRITAGSGLRTSRAGGGDPARR